MHPPLDLSSRAPHPGPRIPQSVGPVSDASICRQPDGEVEACERLVRDGVNLVSWHRELPEGLDRQLVAWAKRFPSRFDDVVSVPDFDLSAATRGLAQPAREWLKRDIAMLLTRLADLANTHRLRVSFGAIRADQCRKFHVDYLRYRLVTTYVGPGTEWVPEDAVNREALDHPPECPCDANKEIVRDASAVRHAAPGEVIVMKGARHPNRRGAVHRSPPIESTGQVRVVLIASTVDGS
jgi:Protein of unknown function (DUF1826)